MVDAACPALREQRRQATLDMLRGLFADQRFDVLIARRILGERWDRRLAARIFDTNLTTATAVADRVAAALGGTYNPTFMHPWLLINADVAATSINDSTRQGLKDAANDDGKGRVFDLLAGSVAEQHAASMVTTAANFGAHDAARASDAGTKTWRWSGRGPRHEDMSGQTVPVSANFSNGLAWPGDPSGGADQVANCQCTVDFN